MFQKTSLKIGTFSMAKIVFWIKTKRQNLKYSFFVEYNCTNSVALLLKDLNLAKKYKKGGKLGKNKIGRV